mmetsp:Transcript_4495/g.10453  ORF Transcript_4495/g.10453 Transcript_4495/m.10453 type:complete len:258 (-) Transcript_4495:610-1383(-)
MCLKEPLMPLRPALGLRPNRPTQCSRGRTDQRLDRHGRRGSPDNQCHGGALRPPRGQPLRGGILTRSVACSGLWRNQQPQTTRGPRSRVRPRSRFRDLARPRPWRCGCQCNTLSAEVVRLVRRLQQWLPRLELCRLLRLRRLLLRISQCHAAGRLPGLTPLPRPAAAQEAMVALHFGPQQFRLLTVRDHSSHRPCQSPLVATFRQPLASTRTRQRFQLPFASSRACDGQQRRLSLQPPSRCLLVPPRCWKTGCSPRC